MWRGTSRSAPGAPRSRVRGVAAAGRIGVGTRQATGRYDSRPFRSKCGASRQPSRASEESPRISVRLSSVCRTRTAQAVFPLDALCSLFVQLLCSDRGPQRGLPRWGGDPAQPTDGGLGQGPGGTRFGPEVQGVSSEPHRRASYWARRSTRRRAPSRMHAIGAARWVCAGARRAALNKRPQGAVASLCTGQRLGTDAGLHPASTPPRKKNARRGPRREP
jgi:hypothetical protein